MTKQLQSTTTQCATILIAEDEPSVRGFMRIALGNSGYALLESAHGRDAIQLSEAHSGPIHLLMTDYNMPGMSGIDVAREVLLINPRLPVAVASGYISDELQSEAQAAGVTEVVFKTDAVEAFCEIVARLVAPPRPA